MFFDPVYLLFALPGFLLALFASLMTKTTFARYSQVPASSGMSGAEAAQRLLSSAGVSDVNVEETEGFLSDHYDPSSKTLRLSPDVYRGKSLSSIGVACHEAGHALQHARGYAPLQLRNAMVPLTNFSTYASYFLIIAGSVFSPHMLLLGAILFSVSVFFTIVTLPVEWDASARAKRLMVSAGIVKEDEAAMAGNVLNAAFLTYAAAAVSSLLILLYYLYRAGLFGGRSRDE